MMGALTEMFNDMNLTFSPDPAQAKMVEELRTDITAYDRYSKWAIKSVYNKGLLKGLPDALDKRLNMELDFCKESI